MSVPPHNQTLNSNAQATRAFCGESNRRRGGVKQDSYCRLFKVLLPGMLPSKNRLKKERDFVGVFRTGHTVSHEGLVFKYLTNPKNSSRFGFVIPNAVIKRAVDRNRLKRKLQELIRKGPKSTQRQIDGVFFVKKDLSSRNSKELSALLRALFRKAGLS